MCNGGANSSCLKRRSPAALVTTCTGTHSRKDASSAMVGRNLSPQFAAVHREGDAGVVVSKCTNRRDSKLLSKQRVLGPQRGLCFTVSSTGTVKLPKFAPMRSAGSLQQHWIRQRERSLPRRVPESVYVGMADVLGCHIAADSDMVALELGGLPIKLFKRAASLLDLNSLKLVPATALARLSRSGGRLGRVESERSLRVVRVYVEAAQFLGSWANAIQWMKTPATHVVGQPPVTPEELAVFDSGARILESRMRTVAAGFF